MPYDHKSRTIRLNIIFIDYFALESVIFDNPMAHILKSQLKNHINLPKITDTLMTPCQSPATVDCKKGSLFSHRTPDIL